MGSTQFEYIRNVLGRGTRFKPPPPPNFSPTRTKVTKTYVNIFLLFFIKLFCTPPPLNKNPGYSPDKSSVVMKQTVLITTCLAYYQKARLFLLNSASLLG